MKVSELSGPLLDFWVARAEGYKSVDDVPSTLTGEWSDGSGTKNDWAPSTDWAQGGPIIAKNFGVIHGVNPVVDSWPDGDELLPFLLRLYVQFECGEEIEDWDAPQTAG
ncbi:phage protein NinX family protein [Paraburkholderia panacisoli]|nr:phage protein NinX family protein [Paraburkholderia panacisoli]